MFLLDLRTFVVKSALSRLRAFWGALLAKILWEGAHKHFKGPGGEGSTRKKEIKNYISLNLPLAMKSRVKSKHNQKPTGFCTFDKTARDATIESNFFRQVESQLSCHRCPTQKPSTSGRVPVRYSMQQKHCAPKKQVVTQCKCNVFLDKKDKSLHGLISSHLVKESG